MSDVQIAPAATSAVKLDEMYINMGPQHPSTHGVLRLGLVLEGEVIVKATPDMGYLHRGTEKIAENRTYQQFITLTDRLDYLASMSNNLGFVMTVEKLMGIKPPERAEYIRVILAELQRVASHLIFFGTYGVDIGAVTPFLYCFRERERILDLFEALCGARLTYNCIRIGGLYYDLPDGWVEKAREFVAYMRPRLKEYDALLSYNPVFLDRTKNVGVLSAADAVSYAASGPVLRGSGVKFDLRKDEPYSVYEKFQFDIPVGEVGDCWDRYYVRMREMAESLRIIEQALATLPAGDIAVKTPRVLKPPPGEVYFRIENPRGEYGYYIVSDGGTSPYRLKIRGPSFVNLQVLPQLLTGRKVADVIAVLGSVDIVLGEVDR